MMTRKVKRIFLDNPTIEEIKKSVEELNSMMGWDKEFPYQKIHVQFLDEVPVRVNMRKVKKLKEMRVKFFRSNLGNFCYTFHSRTGYPLCTIDYHKIYCLSIYGKPTIDELEKAKQRFLARIHPNAWDDIRKGELKLTEENMKTISIKNKFPEWVIEDLKRAFENKTNYYYKRRGTKRDLSVSTKMCDDGIFRAWYSSEYAGCLNGSYYILINPTTAAFREDD